MNNFFVHIGLFFVKQIGFLPFWLLYGISDVFYLIIRLIGYRKKLVYKNLHNAFPEKSEKEIRTIANKFYRNLSDVFFETFKLYRMSEKQVHKRVSVKNGELLDKYYDEGKDVYAIMAHYGNWEWVQCIHLFVKHHGTAIYHPLKSKPYDDFMLKLRSKWGSYIFPMKSSFRDVMKMKKDGTRFVIAVIADQSPKKKMIQFQTMFLNQMTPVHLGAEKMAAKTNDPVVFISLDKIKRGHYCIVVEPLVENPKDCKEYEITEAHVKHLEKIIQEKPEYWLWTHNRWKHSDPNFKAE